MAPLVALAGFMGSGKTSVGAASAELLGWSFIDLDEEVVKAAGLSIPQIFAGYGEADFRRREVEVLRAVLARADVDSPPAGAGADGDSPPAGADEGTMMWPTHGGGIVLALGGGTLQNREAAEMLRSRGGVVLLDSSVEEAWGRACGTGRPLANDRDAFSALLASRLPTYERVADWILPIGDRSVKEMAEVVAGLVTMGGARWPATWGRQLIATMRPCTILGGRGCLSLLQQAAGRAATRGARLFVVTDENVEGAWGAAVRGWLGPPAQEGRVPGAAGGRVRTLIVPAGEQSKTPAGLMQCWEWLADEGARRDDVVVALGGGVVGDLAGFAAATYQRGMELWQIPTSVLAQVDSSVGGKTAVNLTSGKNLVGAFHQPSLVVIDPDTLGTLPPDEFTNGLGEVVKYGLLSGEALFGLLEKQSEGLRRRDPRLLSTVVKTCVYYKARVVEEDELDIGRRAVLNLGHTTGHGLETGLGYGSLGHGQAVALGLPVALVVSEKLLGLDPAVRRRTVRLLEALGLPTKVALPSADSLRAALSRDKKARAGTSGFVGLRALGDPVWDLDVPASLLDEALEVIRA